MNLRYKIPQSKKNFWSSSVNFEKGRDELFGLITVRGNETFEAMRAGGFLVNQIEQTYLDDNEENQIKLLRKILVSIKNRLLTLVENDEEVESIELNAILV